MYNKTNNIMTKSEMAKFKNPLTLNKHNVPQEQNFVTIGNGGNQYCIHRDGSLFRYLKHQSNKNRKDYVKEFPYIYEWSPEGWADFRFRGMFCAYLHFAWILSYNLVRKGRGTDGYIIADPKENPDCDVPDCYRSQHMGWGKSVSEGINRPEFIAQLNNIPHGKQGISFINTCRDQGMHFLQLGDNIFHAALIRVPRTIFPRHPIQGDLSVPEYHKKVHFFYSMEALIEDRKADYDEDYTQELYIANMNDTLLLMDEVDKDRTSTKTDRQQLYKEGSFIGTIARHADRILGSRSTFHASSPDTTTI